MVIFEETQNSRGYKLRTLGILMMMMMSKCLWMKHKSYILLEAKNENARHLQLCRKVGVYSICHRHLILSLTELLQCYTSKY